MVTLAKLQKLRACEPALDEFKESGITEIDEYELAKLLEKRTHYSGGWVTWLFKKFRMTGIARVLYPDGSIKSEDSYKNGDLHGVCVSFHKSGAVNSETNYKNGKAHGESKWFYESGALQYKCLFESGELVIGSISRILYDK